jgi:signal transduction histidine kinase
LSVHTSEQITIKHPILVAFLLGAVGFVGNGLHIHLLLSVDLLFGGIFVMLALQLCGLKPGAIAAIVASCATYLIWDHPYSLLLFSVELVVTGLLYRRWNGNLMLASTVFWIVIGMPLTYILHQYVMHFGYDLSLTIMLKQAINGIMNVVIARITFIWLQGLPRFQQMASQPVAFQERITTILALFVMGTAITLLSIESIKDTNLMKEQIISLLSGARRQAEQVIKISHADGAEDKIIKRLSLLTRANAVFERVHYSLYDKNNVLIASNKKTLGLAPPSGGLITPERDNVYYWMPEKTKNTLFTVQWKQSLYFTTLSTEAGTLVIQTPTVAWTHFVLASTIKTLALTLFLFFLSLIPGVLISRSISSSLLDLGASSSQLPEKIKQGTQPVWPHSSIPEIATLIDDLQQMAVALGEALSDKKTALKRLLAESARREILEELLIEQRQQERLRISRELHDGIGQALQAIKLNLQVQSIGCGKGDCAKQELLLDIVRDIEQTLTDLRTVVIDLRHAEDGKLHLSEALQSTVDMLSANQAASISLQISGVIDSLPENINTAIFFIAQEACSNAVKHACADTIEIILIVTDTKATLEICDNGQGGAVPNPDGAGIAIMQERARLAGGSLSIISPSGSGTTVQFEVTLQ